MDPVTSLKIHFAYKYFFKIFMSAFSFSADIPVKHNITAGDVRFTFSAKNNIISQLLPLPADYIPAQKFPEGGGRKALLKPI